MGIRIAKPTRAVCPVMPKQAVHKRLLAEP